MVGKGLLGRLLTLVVLGLAAWWLFHWARGADVAGAPQPTGGPLFPGLDTDRITYIHLTLGQGHDLELQRKRSGVWKITAPTPEVAREELVALLLEYIKEAEAVPLEQDGELLAASDVGLDPPKHQITFGNDEVRTTLLLGEVEPLGRWVYALRGSRPEILLATRNLVSLGAYHGGEWVDPRLLRGLEHDATHLTVVRPDGVLLEARRVADRWVLEAPLAVLADQDRISQALRSLRFAEQESVLIGRPDDEQRAALGFPGQKAVSEGHYGEATYIEIGNQNEGSVSVLLQPGWEQGDDHVRAVRSDGVKVILVPRDAFSLITNDADWFRDHRMLPPVRERARSVRLEQDGEVILEIQRGPSGLWSFAAPERLAGKPVENERLFGRSALTEFLAVIDSVELTGFTAVPSTEPTRRLVVGWDFGGQARIDRVDIHPATSAGSLPATTTERSSEGLLLGPELLEVFDPLWADRLRELSPLSLDLDTVARFEIVTPGGTTPLVIERDDEGTWTGDDEWGRRYGLAVDLPRSFRGFSWAAERDTPSATFVEFVYSDAEGVIVERIRLREPGADEEDEAYGKPVVLARLDSEPGLELAVPRLWWDAALALHTRPQRTDKL